MKKINMITILTVSFFTAKAQTFSPAQNTGTNIYTYNFNQVKTNTIKQIDFIITGVQNGTFKAKINQQLDSVSNKNCGTSYGDSNYVISTGNAGLITQNKGTISVLFNPKQFEYQKEEFYTDWSGNVTKSFKQCVVDYYANYGIKTATMTVTLYTPNAKDYIINLSGNSVSTVTALDNENKTQNAILFYPNPVKDVLILNQEGIVYDAFGKTILSGKGTMDVSGIYSGIYFVHSAGQVQKFVKE